MYIFFVTTLIAICYILRTVNDNPIEISRHTENLTNDMVFAVLKTCSTLQKQYNQDIQFLLNSGALTKKDIEREADELLFTWGEFPATELKIDPRDFHRLIKIHTDMLQDANDLQIKYLVSTLY